MTLTPEDGVAAPRNDGHCRYSNFANNLFASSSDERRPTISFGTCFSVWPSSVTVPDRGISPWSLLAFDLWWIERQFGGALALSNSPSGSPCGHDGWWFWPRRHHQLESYLGRMPSELA